MIIPYISLGASQVVLVVKNPPVGAGDVTDTGSVTGSGRSPGGSMATHSSILGLENPMVRGAWPVSVHRVAELNMTEAIWCTHTHISMGL